MKITAIALKNVRGFQYVPKTEFSTSINVLLGANNSGKSTILNSIFLIQNQVALSTLDCTIGKIESSIQLFFDGDHMPEVNTGQIPIPTNFLFNLIDGSRYYQDLDGNISGWGSQITNNAEPNNLIYPYLSKRKVMNYNEVITGPNANSVLGNFTNLYSKVDRLITPQFQPGNSQYIKACKNILGFEISTSSTAGGKKAGYFIKGSEFIELTSMGEGVANILGLITDLCVSENKIFLIEELENDIHPRALKALLELIIEKSETNQFFISTHSNIVMKYLGGVLNAKVFNIANDLLDSERPNLFVSQIQEVGNSPEERRSVLEDLGYDFFDFDLWRGWLFLEESSAEVLIRDHFIRWFFPRLSCKIRTFSAGGSGKIISRFEDFDKLFIFLHLEPVYKNKVWVLIDAGEDENTIITKMKVKYTKSGWNEGNFNQFTEHDFEKYYPEIFQSEVSEILKIGDIQGKRSAKAELLRKVQSWISIDDIQARLAFEISAKEVLDQLAKIDASIS